MAIKLSQGLKQTQQLTMTPQLQQAIKLLTLTHLEMTNVIAQEMVENPMLEEAGVELDESTPKEADHKLEKLENQNQEAKSENFDGPELVEGKDDFDWNSYIETYSPSSSSATPNMATRDPDEQFNYENIISQGMNLADHLEWQLRMENLTEDEWGFVHLIIHNLKDDGYLDADLDHLILQSKLENEDALELHKMILQLDPVGCGARDLKECLLAQAKNLSPRLPLLETLIHEHLDDLLKKDYAKLEKVLMVDRDSIQSAELILTSFNPKPGKLVSNEETQYVVPDIYIAEVGGKLQVQLNDEGVPRLRISQLYKSIMQQGKTGDAKTQDYVQEKLRSAVWLMKSIHNRQRTIVKVAEAILRYQPEFFKKGAQYLKPIILKDIANEIGVHESTVSRVTTNKFVHTPLGTFELKYFFNSGIGGKNGGVDIASESLKLKIKKLIDSENKKKPLSDQKVVDLLAKDDVVVARRTIAKYREMLNIPSSSDRKKINS